MPGMTPLPGKPTISETRIHASRVSIVTGLPEIADELVLDTLC